MIEGFLGVRPVMLILLVVLLVLSIIGPWKRLKQGPSIFWVTVFVALIGVNGYMEYKWLNTQTEITKLTQEVSGNKDGYAVCQRWSAAFFDAQAGRLGWVETKNTNRSNVTYYQCKDFERFLTNPETATRDDVVSVAVVIHEAYHVGGDFNEANTQCKTIKKLRSVLTDYGVPEAKVEAYGDWYEFEYSPRMPESYRGGTC